MGGGLSEEQLLSLLKQPLPRQKILVELTIDQCISQLEKAYPDKTIRKPQIRYDLTGATAGQANGSMINLNLHYLNAEWEDMLNDTIPHEFAHVVVRQWYPTAKAHGREWQHIMWKLGLVPTRCHRYDTSHVKRRKPRARPYIYECACGEQAVTATLHRRMQQGKKYKCTYCQSTVIFIREIGQ